MRSVTFSELRNSARKFFDAVERGESVQVFRHGKLVAMLIPANMEAKARWKQANPVRLDGPSLSAAILGERRN